MSDGNDGEDIRIPVQAIDSATRLSNVAARLRQTLNREPSDEELATAAGVSAGNVAVLRSIMRRQEQSRRRQVAMDRELDELLEGEQ